MSMNRAATGLALLALTACAALRSTPPAPEPGFDAAESGAARTFLALSALREDKTDLAGALAATDKALAQQPRSRAAALRRAELLLALDHRDGAGARTQEARAILARASDDKTSLPAQARLAWNEGHRDDATALLQRAADAEPGSAHVQCLLAELLLEQGDAKGAVAAAERALAIDPQSLSAHRARARARLALADAQGAADDAHRVVRASPDEADGRQLLADALDLQGKLAESIDTLEMLPARERTTSIRVALARRELAAGRTALARPLLEEALAAAPGDARVLELALALDLAAPSSERGARLGESLERLDAAAAAHPEDAAVARVRGEALAAAGRRDEAEASFARAIQLDPDDIATYAPFASSLLARRNAEQAVARALELGLAPAPTQLLVGAIREASGDRARGFEAYEAALRAEGAPNASRIAVALGLAASGKAGSLERAAALAREAHAARPGDPFAADALGLVLLASRKPHEAIGPLGVAVGSWPPGPDAGEVRYHLALAYEGDGDPTAAEAQARTAAATAPPRKPEPSWARDARQMVARLAPKSQKLSLSQTASTPASSDAESAAAPSPPPSDEAAKAPAPEPSPTPLATEPAPKTP